jgi:hypothetical protein
MTAVVASVAETYALADRNGRDRAAGAGAVAGFIVAAMLCCLGACTNPSASARAPSSPPAPGTFTVHIGGDMATYVGVARP